MPAMHNPNEGAWEQVNGVFEGADTIEELAELYQENGMTWNEALAKAIHVWNEHKAPPPDPDVRH